MQPFDVASFIRAVLIGIGVGCVTGMVGYFVTRADRARRVSVLIMGGCGMALLAGVFVFYAFPSRCTVPVLDGLSQTQAEDLLQKHKLVPSARPQYSDGVEAGRVIPQSQSPSAGLIVPNGSVVSFGVSQKSTTPVTQAPAAQRSSGLQLFEPKDQGKLRCSRGVAGISRCLITALRMAKSIGFSPPKYWCQRSGLP